MVNPVKKWCINSNSTRTLDGSCQENTHRSRRYRQKITKNKLLRKILARNRLAQRQHASPGGSTCAIRRPCNQKAISCVKKTIVSLLVRAKHPKIVLGVVGAALAILVLGITISLVGVNANTQQDVSIQDVSMEESAQDTASVQHETAPTAASAVVIVESQPAQSPLPDPLAPEPTRAGTPSASASVSVSVSAGTNE